MPDSDVDKSGNMYTSDVYTVDKLEEIRDRILSKLKVGRQSSAGKAIDAFIRELKRASPQQSSDTTQPKFDTPQTEATQPKDSWQDKAQNFLSGVKWDG